jgi:hypothetical protein
MGALVTKFAAGLAIGLMLGMTATAWAAGCFGTGDANGWTVTKDGEEVCSDPSINDAGKEIECQ